MLRRTESPARQPADRFMWPTMARGRVGGGGTSSSPPVRRCLFLHKYNYNNSNNNIYTHTRRASNKHNYNKYYKNILFINAAAAAAAVVTPRRYCNTPAALVILCIYQCTRKYDNYYYNPRRGLLYTTWSVAEYLLQ